MVNDTPARNAHCLFGKSDDVYVEDIDDDDTQNEDDYIIKGLRW